MLKQHSSGIAERYFYRAAKLAAGLAATALLCLGQGAPRPAPGGNSLWAQRGPLWTRTYQNRVEIQEHVRRVRLTVQGTLTIHGGPTNEIQVVVKQSARANSEHEAALRLGPVEGVGFSFAASGELLQLELRLPNRSMFAMTDIEITLPRRLALELQNDRGSIAVNDMVGPVTAETNVGEIQLQRIGSNVTATTGGGDIRIGDITGTVRCATGGGGISLNYAAGDVNCRTGGGDIFMKFVTGALVVSTEGGSVRVERAGGNVRAHSVAGLIEVVQAGGVVTADTLGGSIEVGSSNGVRAESAAGRVKVRGGSGPMNISTMMGDVLAELVRGGRLENSAFATAAGDITLTIPTGMGLSIRARNSSGAPRIQSDFPEIQVKTFGPRSPASGQGSINGGGPTIDLTAGGGAIFLRKAK